MLKLMNDTFQKLQDPLKVQIVARRCHLANAVKLRAVCHKALASVPENGERTSLSKIIPLIVPFRNFVEIHLYKFLRALVVTCQT